MQVFLKKVKHTASKPPKTFKIKRYYVNNFSLIRKLNFNILDLSPLTSTGLNGQLDYRNTLWYTIFQSVFSQLIVKYALERGGKTKKIVSLYAKKKKKKLFMESIEWEGAWPAGPFLLATPFYQNSSTETPVMIIWVVPQQQKQAPPLM